MFMAKKPVSVTLEDDNLLWLRGRAVAGRHRSLSDLLDSLVTEARLAGSSRDAPSRSVVGTVDIADDDPDLAGADEAIGALYARSLGRPILVREAAATPTTPGAASRTRKKRRG